MRYKLLSAAVALLLVPAVVSSNVSAKGASGPVDTGRVLIYGPSLGTGASVNEKSIARSLGYTVFIADSIAWQSLTRSDFERYDAIIIGDRSCDESSEYLNLAAATRSRWTPAVRGNVTVIGTDPVYHAANEGIVGARRLIANGLRFAVAAEHTGAYISLGCAYSSTRAFTSVPVLAEFGPFTVRGQGTAPLPRCPEKAEIVRPASPVIDSLTARDLSNWGCSIHEGIDAYPYPFVVVARHGRSDLPYILTRGPSSTRRSDQVTVFHESGVPDASPSASHSKANLP